MGGQASCPKEAIDAFGAQEPTYMQLADEYLPACIFKDLHNA
jgi:hypothetical protein